MPTPSYGFKRHRSYHCRLAEIESEWHRAMRPSKLFQEANNNEQVALSRWTEGRTAAKSSPEVARGDWYYEALYIYIFIYIYISAPILPFSWEPLVAYIMPRNRGIPIRQDSVPVQYLLSTPSVPLSSLVDLECLSVSGRRVDAWQYYVHCWSRLLRSCNMLLADCGYHHIGKATIAILCRGFWILAKIDVFLNDTQKLQFWRGLVGWLVVSGLNDAFRHATRNVTAKQ